MGFPVNLVSNDGSRECAPTSGGLLPVGVAAETLETLGQTAAIRRPFSATFQNGGSSSMKVNGSGTPVVFSVDAAASKVIFINKVTFTLISVQAGSAAGEGNRFGAVTALTNGIDFEASIGGTTYPIANSSVRPVKTLQDFLDVGFTVDLRNNWQASAHDCCIFTYNFMDPVELWAGTSDKLLFRINDSLTSISFDVIEAVASGSEEAHS